MFILFWAAIGYVAGSLPCAWIVAAITGNRAALDRVDRERGEADAHLLLQGRGRWLAESAAAMDTLKAFTVVIVAVQVAGPYEVAACAIAAVCGHCWPPFLYRLGGRGLASAAGTFLAVLPVEMAVAGLVRVLGSVIKAGGLLSTLGFWAIPVVAWLRDQPMPYVVASITINVLISVRRLEGVEDDVRAGVPLMRALYRRVVLDASAPVAG